MRPPSYNNHTSFFTCPLPSYYTTELLTKRFIKNLKELHGYLAQAYTALFLMNSSETGQELLEQAKKRAQDFLRINYGTSLSHPKTQEGYNIILKISRMDIDLNASFGRYLQALEGRIEAYIPETTDNQKRFRP